MLILALARGADSKEIMPVKVKPKGPLTLKALQFFSTNIPPGILSWGKIIESSSLVLAMEEKLLSPVAQEGMGLFLSKWQIPNFSGNIESVNFLVFILFNHIIKQA